MAYVQVLRTYYSPGEEGRTTRGEVYEVSERRAKELERQELVQTVPGPKSGLLTGEDGDRRRSSEPPDGAGSDQDGESEPEDTDEDEDEPEDEDEGDQDEDLRFSMSPQGRREMAEWLAENRGVPEDQAEEKAEEIARAELFPGDGLAGRVLVDEIRSWIDDQT